MATAEEQQAFEAWVDALSMEDHMIVFQRACVTGGFPHRLNEETGAIQHTHDLDDPEFMTAMHTEYMRMYVGEVFEGMVEDGILKPDGVDADGEILYVKVT